jgi:lipoprotein-anchoring transpeptidase ErfK/SrfK
VSIVNLDRRGAADKLAAAAKNQKITIVVNGTPYSFSAKKLGIERDFSSVLDGAYPPPDTLLDKLMGKKPSGGLKTYVPRGSLVAAVESQLGQYKTTQDASVSVNGGTLSVNPSRPGITINFEQIKNQLASSDLRSELTITAGLTVHNPQILTPAAEAAKKQADVLIAPDYGAASDLGGTKYESLAIKASWLVFTPNPATHTINVSLDSNAAASSMTRLAQSFARPSKAMITLASSDGSTTVLDSGQNGIAVDQPSISDGVEHFRTALSSHQSYTVAIKVSTQPQSVRNLGTSTGGKFVLVDKADFRAYAINNTTVDRTMVVSTGRPGLETPSGHFNILRKTRLVTMTGCNTLVGCWTVPNVPNAEFFTSNGDALHGTYWYINWGHQNASHGCVNLHLADAAWLYDWTVVGTDVVIV